MTASTGVVPDLKRCRSMLIGKCKDYSPEPVAPWDESEAKLRKKRRRGGEQSKWKKSNRLGAIIFHPKKLPEIRMGWKQSHAQIVVIDCEVARATGVGGLPPKRSRRRRLPLARQRPVWLKRLHRAAASKAARGIFPSGWKQALTHTGRESVRESERKEEGKFTGDYLKGTTSRRAPVTPTCCLATWGHVWALMKTSTHPLATVKKLGALTSQGALAVIQQ